MTNTEITSMFKAVFGSQHGQKCLKHLAKTFLDRPIYKNGLTIEETSYRQGQADLVRQILNEVNKDGR